MEMINISADEWETDILNATNLGKERTLKQLAKDGIISKDDADYLSIKYQIITYNKNKFTRLFRKWFKIDETMAKHEVNAMMVDTRVTRADYDKNRLEEKFNGDE